MAVTRAAIAEVTFYNPRPPIGNTPEQPIWRRDHRKMCVIDDRVAFFGGMNMTRKYLATEDEGGMRVSACSSTRASRQLSSCTDTPPQATFVTHNAVSKVPPPSTLHELGINAWPTRTMNAGTRVLAAIQQQRIEPVQLAHTQALWARAATTHAALGSLETSSRARAIWTLKRHSDEQRCTYSRRNRSVVGTASRPHCTSSSTMPPSDSGSPIPTLCRPRAQSYALCFQAMTMLLIIAVADPPMPSIVLCRIASRWPSREVSMCA